MAKLPSGWIFIPRMRMKDGKITIELEERRLVTCSECKFMKILPADLHGHIPYWCDNLNIYSEGPDWFCADGEAKEDE